MTKLEELIEKELEERKGKIKGPYAKYANSRYYSIFIQQKERKEQHMLILLTQGIIYTKEKKGKIRATYTNYINLVNPYKP